jgi:hypothetical protein
VSTTSVMGEPDLADDFHGDELDPGAWVAHYLPHWTTPDRSGACYDPGAEGLRLRIDADQPHWREQDAPMRVSNLQTATFAVPVGSRRGTDMAEIDVPGDATATGTWGVSWGGDGVRVDVDGTVLRTVDQVLDYPLQLMVSLFEVAPVAERHQYPLTAGVRAVRGWSG